jgi:TrmH family RNA methyltransferase
MKELRRIQARRVSGRFVAEGEDLIAAASENGWVPEHHLRAGVDVDAAVLAKVSELASGTRELAVYTERWARPQGPLAVALWGVKDPGNVGTIIRGALAFGAGSVVIGPDTADPYGPKAVRASMGAIFAIPVARAAEIGDLPGTTIALAARTGSPLVGPWPETSGQVTVVVGAEREGLSAVVLEACDMACHIPIASESLNAAMAATLALYELSRVDDA